MNRAVKFYISRFDKEINNIKYRSTQLQKEVLRKILRTPLVKRINDLSELHPTDFHQNITISTYDQYEDKIIELLRRPRGINYFAQSSGTSGGSKKLIPTTEAFVKANHLRGTWYILHTLYHHDESMNVFKSKNLLVGGSIYQRHQEYIIGDVSGIMINRIPRFFHPFYVPSIQTAISPVWEEKIEKTALAAAKTPSVSLLGGVPTWLLTLLYRIVEITDHKDLMPLWPDLKAYVHGGVKMTPYWTQFSQLIPHPGFRYIEVYNATEGFFAFQDRPGEKGMLLMTANDIYFEFIDRYQYMAGQYGEILSLEDVEQDHDYVMIVSTTTGLLRYVMGDVVRFVSIAPYRLVVSGRVGEYINAFGEDLLVDQAERALTNTLLLHQSSIRHYTVAPRYIDVGIAGAHEWYIEFDKVPADIKMFAKDLDEAVQAENINYAQKRTGNIAMECLKIIPLRAGTFNQYIRERGKINAQSKVKKLSDDRHIVDLLLR